MSKRSYRLTSESVTEGHPDKMADQISDAILDELLSQDRHSRVACETILTSSLVLVAGEITTNAYVDIPRVAKETVKEIGYDDPSFGFDYHSCAVLTSIQEQSRDIAIGVSGEGLHKEQGAGDQGMMYGFATNETPEMLPSPILYAHKLTMRLAEVRKKKILPYLGPDGKSQVTVDFTDGAPSSVSAVVIAAQHLKGIEHDDLKEDVIKQVIRPSIPKKLLEGPVEYLVNETGSFITGGPLADTGMTGRKIIVDTYGGIGSHGGGSFSGKDPSKVDRSASYMARYIAKNIVAAGLADRVEVQIAYAIGVAKPVSFMVNAFGTEHVKEERIERIILKAFDMRPKAIIETLDLLRPIYRKTAAYGHFGRQLPEFTWERTDRADELRDAAGL